MADSRTTQQLLEALGFDYNKYDHDSLVREALRELEERRPISDASGRTFTNRRARDEFARATDQ